MSYQVRFNSKKLLFTYQKFARCFPHIVNLACKAVLTAITQMDFASENVADFSPNKVLATSFWEALQHDPIAILQSLICGVSVYYYISMQD